VRDLIFVVVIVVFFAMAGGLVWLCERIIGGGEVVMAEVSSTNEPAEVAA